MSNITDQIRRHLEGIRNDSLFTGIDEHTPHAIWTHAVDALKLLDDLEAITQANANVRIMNRDELASLVWRDDTAGPDSAATGATDA